MANLIRNLLDGIAEKALLLHDRNDCLIKSSIREKVLSFLTRIAKEKKERNFDIGMNREMMAQLLKSCDLLFSVHFTGIRSPSPLSKTVKK